MRWEWERSLTNLNDDSVNVKTEPSNDNDQSQPSKRPQTSPTAICAICAISAICGAWLLILKLFRVGL